jgi:hypothetical protein
MERKFEEATLISFKSIFNEIESFISEENLSGCNTSYADEKLAKRLSLIAETHNNPDRLIKNAAFILSRLRENNSLGLSTIILREGLDRGETCSDDIIRLMILQIQASRDLESIRIRHGSHCLPMYSKEIFMNYMEKICHLRLPKECNSSPHRIIGWDALSRYKYVKYLSGKSLTKASKEKEKARDEALSGAVKDSLQVADCVIVNAGALHLPECAFQSAQKLSPERAHDREIYFQGMRNNLENEADDFLYETYPLALEELLRKTPHTLFEVQ